MWIFCIALPGVNLARADSTVDSPYGKDVASLRLIAAPGLKKGSYEAGVSIAMASHAHTYWQQPGEAGVPPVFAFNGSVNVAKAEVQFPTPSRISEEGIEAFGYTDKVVFPVVVTPVDRSKPAVLKAVVDYAVCTKICIPAHGSATLTLAPGGAGVEAGAVEAAVAAVPTPLPTAERRDLSIVAEKGTAKPSWTVTWSGSPPIDDVFAVAPEGFYFDTKKLGPNRFTLTAAQIVAASGSTKVPVSLTLSRGDRGFVATETLDVPGVSH